MKIQDMWRCEICARETENHDGVRNEILITNGENTRPYIEVCDGCVKKVCAFLDEQFPHNKIAARKKELEMAKIN